jgi:hypothetical protein
LLVKYPVTGNKSGALLLTVFVLKLGAATNGLQIVNGLELSRSSEVRLPFLWFALLQRVACGTISCMTAVAGQHGPPDHAVFVMPTVGASAEE